MAVRTLPYFFCTPFAAPNNCCTFYTTVHVKQAQASFVHDFKKVAAEKTMTISTKSPSRMTIAALVISIVAFVVLLVTKIVGLEVCRKSRGPCHVTTVFAEFDHHAWKASVGIVEELVQTFEGLDYKEMSQLMVTLRVCVGLIDHGNPISCFDEVPDHQFQVR